MTSIFNANHRLIETFFMFKSDNLIEHFNHRRRLRLPPHGREVNLNDRWNMAVETNVHMRYTLMGCKS